MKYILTCVDPMTGNTLTFRGDVATLRQRREVYKAYQGMGFRQIEICRDPEDGSVDENAEETVE